MIYLCSTGVFGGQFDNAGASRHILAKTGVAMSKIEDAEGIILEAITPVDVLSKFLQDHPVGDAPLCAAAVGDLLRPYVEALLAKHREAFELLRGLTASGDGAM